MIYKPITWRVFFPFISLIDYGSLMYFSHPGCSSELPQNDWGCRLWLWAVCSHGQIFMSQGQFAGLFHFVTLGDKSVPALGFWNSHLLEYVHISKQTFLLLRAHFCETICRPRRLLCCRGVRSLPAVYIWPSKQCLQSYKQHTHREREMHVT